MNVFQNQTTLLNYWLICKYALTISTVWKYTYMYSQELHQFICTDAVQGIIEKKGCARKIETWGVFHVVSKSGQRDT